jgi:predicted nucleotide-binding protein
MSRLKSQEQESKPQVFIASSVESLDIANAIHSNLDRDAEVTVWDQGFELSQNILDELLEAAKRSDFGIFVFAPEDVVTIRKRTLKSPRDNVVFELGLFMGGIGKERTFIIAPRGCPELHLPTDLVGLKLGSFNPIRRDGNLRAALGPSCTEIRILMKRRGLRTREIDPLRLRLEELHSLRNVERKPSVTATLAADNLPRVSIEPIGTKSQKPRRQARK